MWLMCPLCPIYLTPRSPRGTVCICAGWRSAWGWYMQIEHSTRRRYSSRVAPRIRGLLDSQPEVRDTAHRILSLFDQDPDVCFGPAVGLDPTLRRANYVITTIQGRRVKVSWRSIIWALSGRDLPANGFILPTCGVAGCCNPSHQRLPYQTMVGRVRAACTAAE